MTTDSNDPTHGLLAIAMSAAVPLHIETMRAWPWADILRAANEAGDVLAEHGDLLMFKSPKRGVTAEVFNKTARGIAALAFAPGGVDVFGMHFEATRTEPCPPPKTPDTAGT